jgi:SAM-dependent methyltransferase
MADPKYKKPELWQSSAVVHHLFGLSETAGALQEGEFARGLHAFETMQPAAPKRHAEEQPEAYSLPWFLDIEKRRHGKQGRWLPKLLEFAKHPGETLLGLGPGLGTDWAQYAHHGASVVVCSAAAAQLALVRRNFALRGLKGHFIQAPPTCLPLDSNSIDVACVSSLHQESAAAEGVIDEIYRVLKPGGKVLAVTPARFDVEFWTRVCFCGYRLRMEKGALPGRRVSARGLRSSFGAFAEHRIHKRHLRRAEVPHLWRWLPLPVLARLMGRMLVLKAFKPLSRVKLAAHEMRKAA